MPLAYTVYEEWGDAKQDVLREEKIRHGRGALGLSEGQVIATSSAHLQRASLPIDFTDVGEGQELLDDLGRIAFGSSPQMKHQGGPISVFVYALLI